MAGNGRSNGAVTGATPPQSSAQWPGALSGGTQYPDMPPVRDDKPLLKNLGASGVAIFSGVITSEEYNEDFYWRDATKIYEQMLRSESQIAAIRAAIELPIRRATWSIQPASDDPVDVQIAAFVESCLFHDMAYTTTAGNVIRQKWDDILRHALMHLWYGYMAFEQVWRVEDGWVKWARWTPLLPRTVWRWWVGEDNELVGIEQWTFKNYNYQFVEIPAGKLLLFTNRQEGNNYEGVSLLRPVYKNWYFVQQFEKIEAIAEERNAVSIPVVQLPQGFTSAELQAAQSIVQNARVNELMGITLPPGWSFDYPRNQQKYAAQSQPSIQYHQGQIARAILADFLQSTTNGQGSYAQTSSRIDFFLLGLQAICEYIEDVINSDAIRRLVDYNFVGVADYPKLKASKLTSANVPELSTALAELAPAGFVDITPEVKSFVAEALGLPASPQSDVQTTNPSAPDDGGDDDQGGNGDSGEGDEGDQESENVNGQDQNGYGDRASDAAALSEMTGVREELAAVRIALAEVDAVSRALGWDEDSVMLYNPYPRGPHGHFGEGGMHGQHEAEGGSGGGVHGQGAEHNAVYRSGGSGGGGGGGSRGGAKAKGEKAEGEKAPRARGAKPKESPEEKAARMARAKEERAQARAEASAKAKAERAAAREQAKSEAKAAREVERMHSQTPTARGAAKAEGEGKGAKGSSKAGKAEGEEEGKRNETFRMERRLEPVARVQDESLVAPYAPMNPHALRVQYGEAQMRAALDRYGTPTLKAAARAMEEQTGARAPRAGREKIIGYLAEHSQANEDVAREYGRIAQRQRFEEETKAQAELQREVQSGRAHEDYEAYRAINGPQRDELVPVGTVDERYIHPSALVNPHALRALYGAEQLPRALGRSSLGRLRAAARIVERQTGEKATLGSKERVVSYLVRHARADTAAMEEFHRLATQTAGQQTSEVDEAGALLLYDEGQHPRGFHGHWVATTGGHVGESVGEYHVIGAGGHEITIHAHADGSMRLHYRDGNSGRQEHARVATEQEAHAHLTSRGITDHEAHAFVAMAHHDAMRYLTTPTREQQARIQATTARRQELDRIYGKRYSEESARQAVEQVYRAYPAVHAAVNAHLEGGAALTPESVATHTAGRTSEDRLAQAREGLRRLSEISEWSLLHSPNVTREGTMRLFHGANSADRETWAGRLSRGLTRGTAFTESYGMARRAASRGLIISAHVPVTAITAWHGILPRSLYSHETEFTTDRGVPITDHEFLQRG